MNISANFFNLIFFMGSAFAFFGLVIYLFHHKNKNFFSYDDKPKLYPYHNLQLKSDWTHVNVVKTGINIEGFPIFDTNYNNFTINAIVWFKFKKNLLQLSLIEQFNFQNAIDVEKKQQNIRIDDDNLYVEYAVKLASRSKIMNKIPSMNDPAHLILSFAYPSYL